jgi:hypothetical protein
LHKEECIVKSWAQPFHRFALNLEAVSKLPIFTGELQNNPFVPITLSTEYMHSKKIPNDEYIVKPIRASTADRGFYSIHSFKERFKIFTNGMFKGLNWDRIYVSGSATSACLLRNPFEKKFGINLSKNDDMLFTSNKSVRRKFKSVKGKLKEYWSDHTTQLNQYFDEYYPSKDVLDSSYLDPEHENYKKLFEMSEKMSDIDIMVDVLDNESFDKFTIKIYKTVRKNLELTKDQIKLFHVSSAKSYKYVIAGPGLNRHLEIFRLYSAHPIGGVSRFHFPLVRGVYDGRKVTVLPSLMSFAYSGMMIDYKWMSCVKDTKDIVCKYYTRGAPLILNQLEHRKMKQHILKNKDTWGYLLSALNGSRSVSISNPAFHPRQAKGGFYEPLKTAKLKEAPIYQFVPDDHQFESKWDTDKPKKSKLGFDLSLRFPAGHIRPIRLWTIQACS